MIFGFGDEYSACLERRESGVKDEQCDPYAECSDVCPAVVRRPTSRLTRPDEAAALDRARAHLTLAEHRQMFPEYVGMPRAPYPPGGAPTGGDPAFRMSADEFARRYRKTDCYKCQVRVNVRQAARLKPNWMFWAGAGTAALGAVLLVATKK